MRRGGISANGTSGSWRNRILRPSPRDRLVVHHSHMAALLSAAEPLLDRENVLRGLRRPRSRCGGSCATMIHGRGPRHVAHAQATPGARPRPRSHSGVHSDLVACWVLASGMILEHKIFLAVACAGAQDSQTCRGFRVKVEFSVQERKTPKPAERREVAHTRAHR